ncbi:MAG: DNA repair protein RecO [Planctomycetota bacterium]
MPTQTTTAIVLRTVEFSETSLVVSLLTRDLGRVSCLAKGARRLKGPFEGSLDLLSVCRVVVIQKPGDSLDLLTESKLRRRFRGGERSLHRTYAGYYVAEMLRLLIDDDDPHMELFDLTLAVLSQLDGTGPVVASLLVFDAQTLRHLGQAPTTRQCAGCGGAIDADRSPRRFSIDGGGVVCSACRPHQTGVIGISDGALAALDRLLHEVPQRDHLGTLSIQSLLFDVPAAVTTELRRLLSQYYQRILGRVPRMQSYV